MVGGQRRGDNQDDKDEVPAGVADEPVEREVQVDPAPARVPGEPVVAAVKVPADVERLVHHRVERRQQRLQDEVYGPERRYQKRRALGCVNSPYWQSCVIDHTI